MMEINGKQVAFVGHAVDCGCPDGPHLIITGHQGLTHQDAPVACVGDRSSCGGGIEEGTFLHMGQPLQLVVATTGSRTSCGGRVGTLHSHSEKH